MTDEFDFKMPSTLRRAAFDPENNRAIFASKGVPVDDPQLAERVAVKKKRQHQAWVEQLKRQRADVYWSYSLLGAGDESFEFSDWHPEEHGDKRQANNIGNKAYKLAQEIAAGTNMSVFMSGNAGTGKTSLALAMLTEIRKQGRSVMFVSTEELANLVNDRIQYPDVDQKLADTLRAMQEVEVLVLDDLGSEVGTYAQVNDKDFKGARRDLQERMYKVANARYNGTKQEQDAARKAGKRLLKPVHSTIITSNNQISELNRIYAERTISRLITQDPNHAIFFNGMPDMRRN